MAWTVLRRRGSGSTVSPTGKQASFASRARASYILAEKGSAQPRTLAAAFVRPVAAADHLTESIERSQKAREAMDHAYGACADAHLEMNVPAQKGDLAAIKAFVTEPCA